MAPQRRTAALVISAFVDPGSTPAWYARISSYRDAFSPAVSSPTQITVDGVCNVVRAWLDEIVPDRSSTNDNSHLAS